ncbi:MAG: lamin tail domain-containing protein [Pirellulaceae bacterium]
MDHATRKLPEFGKLFDARGSSIRTQIERDFARIDFQITPLDSSTVDASVEPQGQGWVDIREIRLAGTDSPLPVEWSEGDGRNADQWHIRLPLAPGLNQLTLEAYGYQGQLLASQTVEVTSTVARRPVQDALRISEINYNPHDALTQFGEAAVDNDEFEFIEFTNIGAEAIDLAGVKLIRADVGGDMEGVEFSFGSQRLLPNQRVVVVQDRTAFQSRYENDVALAVGSGPGTAEGEFAGRLGNDGETLTVVDADGAIVQQIRYNDNSEWPDRADGRASSLVWQGEAFDVNSPAAWSNSQRFGGSPGSDADQFEPTVVINEILSNSGEAGNDRVELVNRSGQSVDIADWYLSDTADDYLKFAMATLPAGVTTVLDASAYWVIDQRTLGFGLRSQSADDLYLVEADASGRPIRFADFVEIPPMDLNDSFGRWPDGTGEFVVQKSGSFGSPNIGPAAEFSGDFNGDQTVDATDIQLLSAAIQNHSPDLAFDLNQDQTTDFMDLVMLVQQIIGSPMGDVNLDGRFNSSDLVLVFQASEFEDNIVGNSTWSTGDWNADGEFTTQDLVVVFQFGGYQNF